ncbi:hypothetical protein BM43_7614 (plasmid) [Burkholderia gladioli]|nr:hypothetical protein BM43_7614 [Burkholderia gladioli]
MYRGFVPAFDEASTGCLSIGVYKHDIDLVMCQVNGQVARESRFADTAFFPADQNDHCTPP